MNTFSAIKLIFLLLVSFSVSYAGQPKLRFEHDWGKPSNQAGFFMLQDKKGFLWFVSGKLIKYAGNQFSTYKVDPSDSTSLSGDPVWALWEDTRGVIWIATDEATNLFDPRTETFTYLERDPSNSFAIVQASAFNEDREGNIWVAGESGELRRVDPKTSRYSTTDYGPQLGKVSDSSSYVKEQVQVIYKDKTGTLWLGSLTGLHQLVLTPQGKGKPSKVSFIHYRHNPADASSLSHNQVSSIFEDHKGVLWVGCRDLTDGSLTRAGGLNAFDRKTGRFTRYVHQPGNPLSLSGNSVTSITEDPRGNLWVGTTHGLNQLNPGRTSITRHLHDSLDASSLRSNYVYSLLLDHSGILWIGTNTGIDKLDLYQKPFAHYRHQPSDPHSLSHNAVSAIVEDEEGIVWIATIGGGLNAWNRKTNRFIHYRHDPRNLHSLRSDRISAMLKDRQGNFWLANGKMLSRLDKKTGRFTHVPLRHPFLLAGFVADPVFALYQDKEGLLWLATTNGIISYDPQSQAMRSYPHTHYSEGMSDWWSLTIIEDNRGDLWIGHGSKALDKLDRKTGKVTRYQYDRRTPGSISSNNVLSSYEDSKGNLWFGTRRGLCRFDYASESFTTFTDKQELAGDAIYSIIEDNQGDLWLGTDNGLSRFSTEKQTFTNYDVNVARAACKGKDGTLYFGGENGFNAFKPSLIRPNSFVPPVVITQFRLFDKPLPGKQESSQVELAYDQNFFSLDFAALSFRSPEKNQYAYQLVGVDKEWVYSGNRHYSTYTDVDPGRYVFRVKGSNNDGVWNQAGTSLIILIHPPFWKTWWFYSLSGLTFVALLSAGFRYRIAQVRKEERLLRKEESLLREQEQQKADFNKKLSEMEMQALRAQMNPHFIFNSLNSINRFILKNEAEAASDYLSKFSRLIRLILQNSNAPTVTLENELEALGLYLEMEALRFDNKFTFRIHCDQEVETEYIEIPPLIIQPYVENAIWHGLMHKQEGGHINIEIGQNEAMLLCSIEDDGVGRKRAGELKSKSATKKKSLGMQITAHRLELLNQVQGKQTTVEIVDLVDPGGEPCGTRVVLQIPV
jgi:ligand-binding sensor domain-containing protein